MKISKVIINKKVKEKILYKHTIRSFEIRDILLDNPYILKTRDGRYIAMGFSQRYITIIFELKDDIVYIITAYPSSDAQRKLYKHKKR